MASDHQKNGNILLSSRPLPALVPESHYIHVCVFCVLITCGPGLTGMFYRVSLYLIVCHLSSYWVTSRHTDDSRPSRLSHTGNLGSDLFNLLQNVIYGGTDHLGLLGNNYRPVCHLSVGFSALRTWPDIGIVDFSNHHLKTVWPGELSDVGYRFIIGLLYFYYCYFWTFLPPPAYSVF